jgi:hypothetical protein
MDDRHVALSTDITRVEVNLVPRHEIPVGRGMAELCEQSWLGVNDIGLSDE